MGAKKWRSPFRMAPVVHVREFILPELPEPYWLRCGVVPAPGNRTTGLIYRLELRERSKVLKVVPWSRVLLREEHGERWVRTAKSRRWAVATFLQRVVDEGYVDKSDLPAKALRKP